MCCWLCDAGISQCTHLRTDLGTHSLPSPSASTVGGDTALLFPLLLLVDNACARARGSAVAGAGAAGLRDGGGRLGCKGPSLARFSGHSPQTRPHSQPLARWPPKPGCPRRVWWGGGLSQAHPIVAGTRGEGLGLPHVVILTAQMDLEQNLQREELRGVKSWEPRRELPRARSAGVAQAGLRSFCES